MDSDSNSGSPTAPISDHHVHGLDKPSTLLPPWLRTVSAIFFDTSCGYLLGFLIRNSLSPSPLRRFLTGKVFLGFCIAVAIVENCVLRNETVRRVVKRGCAHLKSPVDAMMSRIERYVDVALDWILRYNHPMWEIFEPTEKLMTRQSNEYVDMVDYLQKLSENLLDDLSRDLVSRRTAKYLAAQSGIILRAPMYVNIPSQLIVPTIRVTPASPMDEPDHIKWVQVDDAEEEDLTDAKEAEQSETGVAKLLINHPGREPTVVELSTTDIEALTRLGRFQRVVDDYCRRKAAREAGFAVTSDSEQQ